MSLNSWKSPKSADLDLEQNLSIKIFLTRIILLLDNLREWK